MALSDSHHPGVAANLSTTAPNESRLDDPRHLALVFSMIGDAAVLTDVDGRVLDCNPAAQRLLACTPGNLLVRPGSACACGIDAARADAARTTALRDGRWEGELPFTTVTASPVRCTP